MAFCSKCGAEYRSGLSPCCDAIPKWGGYDGPLRWTPMNTTDWVYVGVVGAMSVPFIISYLTGWF